MVSTTVGTLTGNPLLQTKSYIPQWRRNQVSRPRLIERLNLGRDRKLTLISAAAGFGKTTLLAEWLAHHQDSEPSVGWVSLDSRDNDPILFWSYVIRSLSGLELGIGDRASGLLHAQEAPPIESILTVLINGIGNSQRQFTLVLDDFHVIEMTPIHDGVAYLLDHLPPNMHVIVASRSDPPFPLARLRGRGDVIELRAADLRFTPEEATAFFSEMAFLRLSESDVAALEVRTEGWIAGLQLAALSLQGRPDVSAFINAFAGDDHYIVDYLMEEVLHQQPDHIRQFLLETSVLDRLCGSLCNALTGRDDGKTVLDSLNRTNLFVVPLDDKRIWFRYHHLFADVLRARLLDEYAESLPLLRIRAAHWFEANGMATEAIEHAVAGGDFEMVARLLVINYEEINNRQGLLSSVSRWCKALPEELVRRNPRLALIYAAVASQTEPNLELARRLTAWAEQAIELMDQSSASETDCKLDQSADGTDDRNALKGELLLLKIQLTRNLPPAETLGIARRVLDLLPSTRHQARAMSHQMIASMEMNQGQWDTAGEHYRLGLAEAEQANDPLSISRILTCLGESHVTKARLEEAKRSFEEAISSARRASVIANRELCQALVGLSTISLEHDEIAEANAHITGALELAQLTPMRSHILLSRCAAASVCAAMGDATGAFDHLQKAREFARGSRRFRYSAFLSATEITIACELGELERASALIRERDLKAETAVETENVDEMIAFARYLWLRGDLNTSLDVISRACTVAQFGGLVTREIQALLFHALISQQIGSGAAALQSLTRAIHLAEPGRFVRTFTSAGAPLQRMLEELVASIEKSDAPGKLTSIAYITSLVSKAGGAKRVNQGSSPPSDLPEPFTERETEVLRLIAAGLRNQEIADQLFISLATVKRHIANAYGKMGVQHRGEAMVRLGSMNLN